MHGKVVPNEGYKVAYIFFISLATVATFVSLGYRLRIGRLLEGELHGISVKYNHHENAVKKAGPPSPLPDSSVDRAQNHHRQASQNLGSQKLGSQKLGSQKLGSQNLRLTNKAGVVRSSLKKQASVEASGLVDFRKQAQKYEWELLQSSRTLTICALTLLTIAVQELPFTVLNCNGPPFLEHRSRPVHGTLLWCRPRSLRIWQTRSHGHGIPSRLGAAARCVCSSLCSVQSSQDPSGPLAQVSS
jgi:hypothetical protein